MQLRKLADALLIACVALLGTVPASAAEALRGDVVSVHGRSADIRHAGTREMPAMTMTFTLPTSPIVRPGDRIAARADSRTEPWSLHDVRVIAHRAVISRSSARTLQRGETPPDTAFVDQRGRPFSLSSLLGTRYALAFIYTRCRDAGMCPLISAQFAAVQRDHAADGAQLVEVTLDSTFDRPAVLERYAHTFGADPRRWHLLTGDAAALRAFADAFGVQQRPGAAGIVHTERTAVMGSDGRIERFLDNIDWTPNDLTGLLVERPTLWDRFARIPQHALVWCGDHLGAGGRTAVHHTAILLLPMVVLAFAIAALSLVTRAFRREGQPRHGSPPPQR